MTERRETGRKRSARPQKRDTTPSNWEDGERIAKYLARAGICSRRDAEKLIEAGKVIVNGKRLDSPAFKVTGRERISVHGEPVRRPEPTRLWRYHKPAGLLTTTSDPEGRATIFDHFPKNMPRMMTVGRLDLTTEGLLLLTNNGELARALELPATGLEREYRARAHGRVTPEALKSLVEGVIVNGDHFAPMQVELERTTGTNNWLRVILSEGQNREVRRALDSVGLVVNRLIRVRYGGFELGDQVSGTLNEISPKQAAEAIGESIDAKLLPAPQRPQRGRQDRPQRRHR